MTNRKPHKLCIQLVGLFLIGLEAIQKATFSALE